MSYITERISYLRGLADGLDIFDATPEAKLLSEIIDVLESMAQEHGQITDLMEELEEYVDAIDEDLAEVELLLFDDELEDEELTEYYDDEDLEDDDEDVEVIYPDSRL